MSTSITEVLEGAEISEGVNSKAVLTCTLPRSALPEDLSTVHEVGFERGSEGELFRGYVADFSTEYAEDGSKLITMVAEGREVELEWVNTHHALLLDDVTPQVALNTILETSSPTWTGSVLGTGYPATVAKSFDNMSLYDCVLELAKILQGYVVFNGSNRTVWILNYASEDVNLVLRDTPNVTLPHTYGLLQKVNSKEEDRSNLWNRIVPEAKVDGDNLFDLRDSTRTSPYTIGTVEVTHPFEIGDYADNALALGLIAALGTPPEDTQWIDDFDITCAGHNRLLLIFGLIESTSTSGLPSSIRANNRPLTQFYNSSGSGMRVLGYYLQAPDVGVNTIENNFTGVGPPGDSLWIAIALDGVRQRGNPIRDTSQSTVTAATTINATVDTNAKDLVISLKGISVDVADGDEGANERFLTSQSAGFSGNDLFQSASAKDGDYPSTTVSYTWVGNRNAILVGVSLKPQPVHYIEDATSISAYGRRTKPLGLGTFKVIKPKKAAESSNTMYDYTVKYLQDSKDPRINWNLDVSWIPFKPTDWIPGELITIDTADIPNTEVVVPRRKQKFLGDGTRVWNIDAATNNAFKETFFELIKSLKDRQDAIQFNQV